MVYRRFYAILQASSSRDKVNPPRVQNIKSVGVGQSVCQTIDYSSSS